MNSFFSGQKILEREHRRARITGLLWSAAVALVGCAISAAGRLGWLPRGELWALIPCVFSASLLARWLRRARTLTREAFARELDSRLKLRSRLEAAVELSETSSPIAVAQRTDALLHFSGRESTGRAAWLAAVVLACLSFSFLTVELGFVFRQAWRNKQLNTATGSAASAKSQRESPATLEWESPEAEVKATAIEEVPLKASAQSARGFRAVSLEILVNGEHKFSRPLDKDALGDAGQKGTHELTPSLYLDEVGAQPLDIVSYYLKGEAQGDAAGRVVTSPLQFVQIRASREDVGERGGLNPKLLKMISLLGSLKLAQLRLMEANFGLDHLVDAKNEPAWKAENSRVATAQFDLAAKAVEARIYALTIRTPFLISVNLAAAGSSMKEASRDIAVERNEDAVAPQGKALALITECEKLFNRALQSDGPQPPLPHDDPFRDQQTFRMPPREETPAGELEKLAAQQREANAKIGQTGADAAAGASGEHVPESDAALKALAATEEQIAQAAQKLAEAGALDADAQKLLKEAGAAAARSATQLEQNDQSAAREPAGKSLALLEKAVETQERVGRENAAAQLEEIGRGFNNAGHLGDAGERKTRLAAARDELRASALQQQRTGSAEAARQLATLAEATGARNSSASSAAPGTVERARDLARASARTQIELAPRDAAVKRVARVLHRTHQALASGGNLPSDQLSDLELAVQQAEWLAGGDANAAELAHALENDVTQLGPDHGAISKESLSRVVDGTDRLATMLELGRSHGRRDEVVRQFNIEKIDPLYRGAVETYFERLSRENSKVGPKPVGP